MSQSPFCPTPESLEGYPNPYKEFVSQVEWKPYRDGKFVVCRDEGLSFEEPAYWQDYKFWIIRGFLKGKELPFVSHWRYMTKEEFVNFMKDEPLDNVDWKIPFPKPSQE